DARSGSRVSATDWRPEAVCLATRNAEANRLRIETALVDWRAPTSPNLSAFDVVLAADVLYEERNAVALLGLLTAPTADEGTALIADPGRRHSTVFFDLASESCSPRT